MKKYLIVCLAMMITAMIFAAPSHGDQDILDIEYWKLSEGPAENEAENTILSNIPEPVSVAAFIFGGLILGLKSVKKKIMDAWRLASGKEMKITHKT